MSLEEDKCQICKSNKFKYTCPRCSVTYCSLNCYKSQGHLKCSEAFYKQCIKDELAAKAVDGANNEDMRKIYDILRRIRESDAGIQTDDFDQDSLDSDNSDDAVSENEDTEVKLSGESNNEECFEELHISDRLKNVDINDADEVWEHLTQTERDEFKGLLRSGDITKMIPVYTPWWLKERPKPKIVVLPETPDKATDEDMPRVIENIPVFSAICSKEPAPCVHYNLWNILGSYACMSRYFNGEYQNASQEAAAHLINLCSTLKYGTNFEDVEDAIVSVEMEALTTGNGVTELMPTGVPKSLIIESRDQLKADARQLMSSRRYKLTALSDILSILQKSKMKFKKVNKSEAEFQKLFALSSGMEELTKSRIQQLCKKMEFYLSYVNRDAENDLK